ncbi:unnamed protein product [Rotaria sp. Silwood2]|nr:unnamed protein product [Rotaria sp. Silwood2]CAF2642699.1 unnamed protein product [Rotaria sp. Silwood2]CAF2919855.1 unnamed protein product [Rotaria sp. Silwood2]CAF3076661.1 unnamed protein product [Rotaria sp. Silwood2]CAF3859240.1 unnamed protein product [Rotaria sp. Silwood2]
MSSQGTNVVGHWKVVDYPQHPECIGCQFNISHDDETTNLYRLNAHVVNSLFCPLEHNPISNEWTLAGAVGSTLMLGPPEEMKKENIIGDLISRIQNLEVEGGQHLVITTNNGEQIRLERSQ